MGLVKRGGVDARVYILVVSTNFDGCVVVLENPPCQQTTPISHDPSNRERDKDVVAIDLD
jgi:hypothetical protein